MSSFMEHRTIKQSQANLNVLRELHCRRKRERIERGRLIVILDGEWSYSHGSTYLSQTDVMSLELPKLGHAEMIPIVRPQTGHGT